MSRKLIKNNNIVKTNKKKHVFLKLLLLFLGAKNTLNIHLYIIKHTIHCNIHDISKMELSISQHHLDSIFFHD